MSFVECCGGFNLSWCNIFRALCYLCSPTHAYQYKSILCITRTCMYVYTKKKTQWNYQWKLHRSYEREFFERDVNVQYCHWVSWDVPGMSQGCPSMPLQVRGWMLMTMTVEHQLDHYSIKDSLSATYMYMYIHMYVSLCGTSRDNLWQPGTLLD